VPDPKFVTETNTMSELDESNETEADAYLAWHDQKSLRQQSPRTVILGLEKSREPYS
jgi:hypothetical protein